MNRIVVGVVMMTVMGTGSMIVAVKNYGFSLIPGVILVCWMALIGVYIFIAKETAKRYPSKKDQ